MKNVYNALPRVRSPTGIFFLLCKKNIINFCAPDHPTFVQFMKGQVDVSNAKQMKRKLNPSAFNLLWLVPQKKLDQIKNCAVVRVVWLNHKERDAGERGNVNSRER